MVSYPKTLKRHKNTVDLIEKIKADHPFWGYRRVWATLRFKYNIIIGKNTVLRLMKHHQLLVKPNMKLKASRTLRSKPRATKPNQIWGTDMTKVMTHLGWVYVVVVLDWYTKKIVGHYVGYQSKSWHWLIALNKALNKQFVNGVRDQSLKLVSDNGCQPTSLSYMQTCNHLNIEQIFTSYNNPKGNADTERVIRTIKEELLWLHDWNDLHHIEQKLDHWINKDYNQDYFHSSLDLKTPNDFENTWFINNKINQQNTPLKNAC